MRVKEIFKTAALVAAFTLTAATAAFAGEWLKDSSGEYASYYFEPGKDYSWWYRNDDGSYARNAWVGNYYLDDRGYMLSSCLTPDGYLLNADGSWYVATPEQAEEAYEMFRIYKYAVMYDATSMVSWYREEDFNGDGVLDLLMLDFGGEERTQNLELSLYTIQDGTVRKMDDYTGNVVRGGNQPRAYLRWYEDEKKIFCLSDDTGEKEVVELLRIDENLKFQVLYSEGNQIAPERKAELSDYWLWGERDFSGCEMYELVIERPNCRYISGQCEGQENSVLVEYSWWN